MAIRKIVSFQQSRNAAEMTFIQDPLEQRQILERARENRSPVLLQIKPIEKRFSLTLLDELSPTGGLLIEGAGTGAQALITKAFEEAKTQDCLMLIILKDQYLVGVSTRLVGRVRPGVLEFEPPSRLCRIQRRATARYAFPAGYELFVELESLEAKGHRIKKRLYDVSEGGLSFHVLSSREAGLYRPGNPLLKLRFTIQGREMITDVEIRGRTPAPKHLKSGEIIGVRFLDLTPVERQFLAEFVLLQHLHHPPK